MRTLFLLASLPVATAQCIIDNRDAHDLYPDEYSDITGDINAYNAWAGNLCMYADACLSGTLPASMCDIPQSDLPPPFGAPGYPFSPAHDMFWLEVQSCCNARGLPRHFPYSLTPAGCDLTAEEMEEFAAAVDWVPDAPSRTAGDPGGPGPITNYNPPPECAQGCVDPGNTCITSSREYMDRVVTSPCASGPYGGYCKVGFCGAGCGGVFELQFRNGATEDTICQDTDGDGCIDSCDIGSDLQCVTPTACPDGGRTWNANTGECDTCD